MCDVDAKKSNGWTWRGRRGFASALGLKAMLAGPVAAMLLMLGAASPVSAATIQIGTFDWDAIAEDEDEFLFFCDATTPCSRFTITNDLDDLTSSELASIGLPSSDAAFDDVRITGVLDDSLGSLTAALGSFVWIKPGDVTFASLLFQLPLGASATLLLPTLTGPIGDPMPILVEFSTDPGPGPDPTPVPEPASLMLVGTGVLVACRLRARRGSRQRA